MRKQHGFTLIELVIVVAIVAILSAVAMPSYFSHVEKGYRQDAMGALVVFAQTMERFYTTNGSYIGADGKTAAVTSPAAPTIFATEAPLDGSKKLYDLKIAVSTATSYTITATPKSDGRMAGDGVIALRSTGQRGWDRNGDDNAFGSKETCWEKTCP
ncbi:type IV pilin protein [Halioxenophilus aromaticivorans]|uniref:Type 4a pilus minor pilin PilE n=1 Tax=Halioxenophilus aromaticivorans TaxID=1306992 RepID=A0AAV3TZF7_9ALTE